MQPRNARDAGDSPAKPVVVVMVDGCGSPLAGSAHHDGRADGIGVDEEAEHENAGEGPGDGKNACGCMREMGKNASGLSSPGRHRRRAAAPQRLGVTRIQARFCDQRGETRQEM